MNIQFVTRGTLFLRHKNQQVNAVYCENFVGKCRVLLCSSRKFYFLSPVTFRISISYGWETVTTAVSHRALLNRRTETRHLNACQGIREERYGSVSANVVVAYFQLENDFLSCETLLITAVISWRCLYFLYNNSEIRLFSAFRTQNVHRLSHGT
jgi:hypothetical protein